MSKKSTSESFQISDNECYSTIDPVPSNVLAAKVPVPAKKKKMNCFVVVIVMATILNFLLVIGFGATLFYFQTNLAAEVTQLTGQNGMAGYEMTGLKGEPGEKGDPGQAGLTGATGSKGSTGQTGLSGNPGLPGQKGDRGQTGLTGSKGSTGQTGSPAPVLGGITYNRWGKSSCRSEADLVYAGKTGVSFGGDKGGASNYICMPDDPQYTLPYQSGVQGYSHVYGTEYEGPPLVSGREQHNAPCAVCYVSTQHTVIMIPAKTTCPSGWTREYYGYLMSERIGNNRSMYECVDRVMEPIPGSQNDIPGGHFYHVEAHCNGVACPPYNNQKELTCVVCTK